MDDSAFGYEQMCSVFVIIVVLGVISVLIRAGWFCFHLALFSHNPENPL